MKMEKMKDELLDSARSAGVCEEGYSRMRGYDRDGLIDYYKEMPDWCLERNFPSLEMMRREFSDIEDKGIFVDKTFNGETVGKLQTYIFHNCKGTINVEMDYDNAVIPMLYFANGCNIRVECHQQNKPAIRVPIYIFGKNKISAKGNDNAIFKKYRNDTGCI